MLHARGRRRAAAAARRRIAHRTSLLGAGAGSVT
jgi:hypothetical protein